MLELINFILHFDNYLGIFIGQYGFLIYFILFFIIFLETGFVITPFLPGDSLLFISGVFASNNLLNIFLLWTILSFAAILGDTINYWIGNFFGEKAFSRFIKKEHLEKTKTFYEKHGVKTIILARFVPIVRTFAPFVAGVGKMQYKKFIFYNIIGGISWVTLFLFGGYFFGNISIIEKNLTLVSIIIIIISVTPMIFELIKSKLRKTGI